MTHNENFLDGCLFFNTNSLSRHLLKLAQAEFNPLKLSPAHASLLLVLYDRPGITPKQLSKALHLTPSTITRFLNALESKKLLTRETAGKLVFISPSTKGLEIKSMVARAYSRLYRQYEELLGQEQVRHLTAALHRSVKIFERHPDSHDQKS